MTQYERPVRWVTVGRKGRDLLRSWIARIQDDENAPAALKDQTIIASFSNMPADPDIGDVTDITHVLFDDFLSVPVDEVFIAYTHFINSITQQPRVLPLLPLRPFEARSRQLMELVEPDKVCVRKPVAWAGSRLGGMAAMVRVALSWVRSKPRRARSVTMDWSVSCWSGCRVMVKGMARGRDWPCAP